MLADTMVLKSKANIASKYTHTFIHTYIHRYIHKPYIHAIHTYIHRYNNPWVDRPPT